MSRLEQFLLKKLNRDNTIKNKENLLQFIKFGLVGVSNTLVAWAFYYFFLWIDEDLYMVGSIVGGIVSIANAFYWNDKYVFKNNNNDWKSKFKRLGKTYISYGGTSLFGMILLWVEVNYFGVSKVFAPPITLLITIPLNFCINKFWTFRNK